jgi:hypothetical protein
MTLEATPPGWAEALLRISIGPRDFDAVAGDLLEEYRDSVLPSRGGGRADLWYVAQVSGFVWRSTWVWAVLFAAAFIGRTALDWLAPSADLHTRADVSTALGIGLLLAAAFTAARRARSPIAGVLAGVATAAIAAVLSTIGTMILLAVWHDPRTMNAIRESGGLGEAVTLPLSMLLPGAALGTVGGVAGAFVGKLLPARP